MNPRPHLDPEFSCPGKPPGWHSFPRSLGRLMILIALFGLVLSVYSTQTRPTTVPIIRTPVALQRRRVAPRGQPIPPRHPAVIVARPGIDDAMIHTARQGIDEGMIVNPGRLESMPVLTAPQPDANGVVPVLPGSDSTTPERRWAPRLPR